MKSSLLVLASLVLVSVTSQAQRLYSTAELEIQLSYADVSNYGVHLPGIPRYSPFNFIHKEHLDFGKHFGLFTGISLRNTGFVYKLDEHRRINERVITLGAPFGVKIGRMQRGFYVAFGGDMELALNYKQKLFVDGKKQSKFNEWFSPRTQLLNPSLFLGARFKGGESALYLRYYPLNWYNEQYAVGIGEELTYPNAGKYASLFTLTWAINLDCNCGCPQSQASRPAAPAGGRCCTTPGSAPAPEPLPELLEK